MSWDFFFARGDREGPVPADEQRKTKNFLGGKPGGKIASHSSHSRLGGSTLLSLREEDDRRVYSGSVDTLDRMVAGIFGSDGGSHHISRMTLLAGDDSHWCPSPG